MSLPVTHDDHLGVPARRVFLSASIPNPERWSGEFDSLAITDAVVALGRAFLSSGWEFVTAMHPTIAPLLMYVASELPVEGRLRIVTYQSQLFENSLPPESKRFLDDDIGRVIWTPAVEGDQPEHGAWDRSVDVMRRQMLLETAPAAAVFVGGMDGIRLEYDLFGELRAGRPRYALGAPGGAARMIEQPATQLNAELVSSAVFPAVARAILRELN